jgi:hypothetical protein
MNQLLRHWDAGYRLRRGDGMRGFFFLGSNASFVDLVRGCSDGAPPADPRLLGSLEKRKKKYEK